MNQLVLRLLMLSVVLLGACAPKPPRVEEWLTYYEKSNHLETPRYDETVAYLQRLEQASPWVNLTYFGVSPQGRMNPLVIVDKDRRFNPQAARQSGKNVLLIQAGIHAGEIDGKDAGMMLIRDLVIFKKNPELLDHTVILFMPFFNVDGHERFGPYNRINQNGPKEMGWRTTAQNLNLNRDYMKADAPEMRDWLKLFQAWKPDILLDCHVTDGADYRHAVTYAIDQSQNLAPSVRSFTKDIYMPELKNAMAQSGFPMSPYVNLVEERDIAQGLIGGNSPPRFSTGYAALQNRIGFLIETHMFKDYKTRVDGTYNIILHTLETMHRHAPELRQTMLDGDASAERMTGSYLPITFRWSKADTIDFLGYNFRMEKSAVTGESFVYWENVPIDYRLPFYDQVSTTDSALVPYAFIVPQQWTSVLERLEAHGIVTEKLDRDRDIKVISYRFSNAKWSENPFEGRLSINYKTSESEETRRFKAGDRIVKLNQRTARVIMHLLEPRAPDALVQWGFFNAIFEQKEYGETYKLELLARDMLAKDGTLRAEFEKRVKEDKNFTGYNRLNWFYERSPWWDKNVNLYPVGKILTAEDISGF